MADVCLGSAERPFANADPRHYEFVNRIWNSQPFEPPTPPEESVQDAFFQQGVSHGPLPSVAAKPYVAVIGVGYVGQHIVESFARHYQVLAYDVSCSQLNLAKAKVTCESLSNIEFTNDSLRLSAASYFLIAVPTLFSSTGAIDTTYIRSALTTVAVHAKPGSTIVIESSVSVGMTRSLLTDICRHRGLKAGMSPERVDPGRIAPAFEEIPKIISGLDDVSPGSLASVEELYRPVFHSLVQVSSPEVAEMTKLYENCQRMLCVAFANEMADACEPLGIDPFEVSKAAATKPFGYLPMSPSAGVGGHCIPVNPHYLFSTSAFPLLKEATLRMQRRPADIADRAVKKLCNNRPSVQARRKALVVGVGFKRGQGVLSNSPGQAIAERLKYYHDCDVQWVDPLVPQDKLPHIAKLDTEVSWTSKCLNTFGLIIVAVRQIDIELDMLQTLEGPLIEWWQR